MEILANTAGARQRAVCKPTRTRKCRNVWCLGHTMQQITCLPEWDGVFADIKDAGPQTKKALVKRVVRDVAMHVRLQKLSPVVDCANHELEIGRAFKAQSLAVPKGLYNRKNVTCRESRQLCIQNIPLRYCDRCRIHLPLEFFPYDSQACHCTKHAANSKDDRSSLKKHTEQVGQR